jgi:hypothetical protein
MLTIDKKLLSFKTNKYLKKNNIGRETIRFDQAKKIGILFSVEDRSKHDVVVNFVNRLKEEGKDVSVLCFRGKNKENYDFKFDFFSSENLSFWGKMKSQEVDKFTSEEFDFLYCLDIKTNVLTDYILAKSRSRCRVGIYNEHHTPFLELMIKVDEFRNMEKITDQLLHYTKELIK